MPTVAVSGSFDDLRSPEVRLLHEASRFGSVRVLLWSDRAIQQATGTAQRFPVGERLYFVEAIRYVDSVTVADGPDAAPPTRPDIWVCRAADATQAVHDRCVSLGSELRPVGASDMAGFPEIPVQETRRPRKKVVVTGCYDWLHSGHVRFFEEAAEYGDLYVVVGSDANVHLLKGPSHPRFSQDERRYMVGSIRHVHRALISSGVGWMDAEPEIAEIRPDTYIVNEDGDKPEKREFCEHHGLEYLVLKRVPREGLPRRQSTELRGF